MKWRPTFLIIALSPYIGNSKFFLNALKIMSRIIPILILCGMLVASCGTYHKASGRYIKAPQLEANGKVIYAPDSSPMAYAEITRLSDHKNFLADKNGNFKIPVEPDDSLCFSYVGVRSRTISVSYLASHPIVSLDSLDVTMVDEFIYNNQIIGTYANPSDGSSLTISSNSDRNGYDVKINLARLTSIDDGFGKHSDGILSFTATDASGNPISGKISFDGDQAKLTFTDSTWKYLPDGSVFEFVKLAYENDKEDFDMLGTDYKQEQIITYKTIVKPI